MKIEFFVPAPAQSVGGIERAILGFEQALSGRYEITRRLSSQPDKDTQLVHFHGIWNRDHLSAYRYCQKNDIPYIISPHGMLEPWAYRHRRWKKWAWMKLFGKRQLDHAACVLATSQMEAEHLQPFARKIRVAPLGLQESISKTYEEARRELGISPTEKVVLYLSRIDRKKGLDLLIDAMADHPDWKLLVVGDGDQNFEAELKRVAGHSITWIGPVWGDERWTYLFAADLFCLPTHSENFGFAILEALWAGTPTLTTDKTPWAARAEVEGLHICNDDLDSLKRSLGELLPHVQRPEGLADWAQENFSLEHLAETYDAIYRAAAKL